MKESDLYKIVADKIYSDKTDKIRSLQRRSKIAESQTYWAYIPSHPHEIVKMILDIGIDKLRGKCFMDVGCGYPIIPSVFKELGAKKTRGLEFQIELVNQDETKQLIYGDILKYNFRHYDILYAYTPIKDTTLMKKGLERIVSTMKKGATFYFCGIDNTIPIARKMGFKVVGGYEWSSLFKFKKQ